MNSGLVYSTEKGRLCPQCGNPVTSCKCKKNTGNKTPQDGIIRVRREIKGRKGKTVTTITGVPGNEQHLKQLAAELKKKCGTGGSVKEGIIIIQGDRVSSVLPILEAKGYTAKRSGG